MQVVRMALTEISVIVPVLNEAPNIAPLSGQLRDALEPVCESYEIIFVGGGSTDGTEDRVLEERMADPRVKLLWLSRSFGHQANITAGMDFASGRAVITMDGDLQHPPTLLPELIELWRKGYQVVTTHRVSTADAGIMKRLFSRWFYKLFNAASGLSLQDGSADFRLLDRSVVDALKEFPERARFFRGLVQWIGYEQTSIMYTADPRNAGSSKYSLGYMLKFGLLATLSFSATPLYLVAVAGFAIAALSFLYGIYAIVAKVVMNVEPAGWASLLAALAFLGGVQLISMGVVGAYVARIYEETKGRPIYLVKSHQGLQRPAGIRRDRATLQHEELDYP
jgi:glycosyltransferase involved in cell wall biosynthesis